MKPPTMWVLPTLLSTRVRENLGRKVLLPAGVIERIDLDRREVEIRLTKDQIKNAPELDEVTDYRSDTYREQVGTYYSTYS